MRVLIIEDEARIAKAIKKALEHYNFAADIVTNSDDGLAAAVDPDYDLIILDRRLPGSLDGIEICEKVRASNVGTPILMLTALGDVDNRVDGLKSGADDYLTKPFSMKELIVRSQVLLRRRPKPIGPVVKVDDLEVNLESFHVQREGNDIKLSSREFKLLSYLIYHKGIIISKDRLINHVWDGDSLIMPNTVEVYIGYLRKKIDRAYPNKPQLITTVHGFGYKIGDTDV